MNIKIKCDCHSDFPSKKEAMFFAFVDFVKITAILAIGSYVVAVALSQALIDYAPQICLMLNS